jgi:hypothetical protein
MGPVLFLVTIRRRKNIVDSMYSDFVKRVTEKRGRYMSLPDWLDLQWQRLHRSWFEKAN